jgi:hypothetical protein
VRLRIVVFLLACAWAASTDGQPLGTAFTYQGHLVENGTPATGPYDLEIKLFDAPAGGTQVFTTLLYEDVAVGNGLFTVALDFGPSTFAGSARWLEIGVRPGASTGAFTTLSARQELTPSPHAIFGATAPWAGILGKPAGFADDMDNDSGGDITAVNTPPGNGLVGGGTTGALTLGVAFGGSGSGGAVSRVDHDHVGQTWVATANPALTVASSATSGAAIEGQATALTGLAIGLRGSSTSSQGVGVLGMNTSTAGTTFGVNGFVASGDGIAVQGIAAQTAGSAIGVHGRSASTNGRGVYGLATANSGSAHGVFGETESVGNIVVASGVSGHATSTTGFNFGVRGVAASTGGVGVAGLASATSGTTIGMWGLSQSNFGSGVRAEGSGSTGTALEILNGRIKATGAGVDTATPAFRIASGQHECLGGTGVVVDHPQANGNGGAMLFVTARGVSPGEASEPHSFSVEYQTIGFLDCPAGRWVIFRDSSTIDSGYNVLVVVP